MSIENNGSNEKGKIFQAGDIVLKQGNLAIGEGLYILMSGELEVLYDGVKVAEITDKGAFVGEIASILGGRRIATVVAKTEAELIYIEDVTRYFETNPASALLIAKTLAVRIMEMDKKVADFENFVDKWTQAFKDVLEMDDISGIKNELLKLHDQFVSQIRAG